MRTAWLSEFLKVTVLSICSLGITSAQEHPSSGCSNPNGCLSGTYYNFDNEVATIKAGPDSDGNGRGAKPGPNGSTSTGGPGGPGSTSDPGVEPSPGLGPLPGLILRGLFPGGGGPGRGPGREPPDPRALQPPPPPFTPPSLLQLPGPPTPGPSISPYRSVPSAYSQWDRSALGSYVETNADLLERMDTWRFTGPSGEKAATPSLLGSSPALSDARIAAPARITREQRSLSSPPPPIYGAIISADNSNLISTSPSNNEEVSEQTYEWSKKAIEIGTERAVSTLDRDIESVRKSYEKNTISQKDFNAYIKGAEDTKAVVSGLGTLLTTADYLVGVKKVLQADPGKNTQYQAGKLAYQIGSDLAGKAGQKGVSAVATALFPKLATYIVDVVGTAVAVVQITFDSEETGKDPSEIVRDTSGRYSLEEKQKALTQELKWYQQKKPNTAPTDDLLQQLQLLVEEEGKIQRK